MSAISAYTEIVKRSVNEKESAPPPEEDATRFNARIQWVQSTITQEHIVNISNEVAELIKQSVELSVSYPQHKNADKIIQNLVRVDTLEKILLSYKKLYTK